jgi:hypothetical protein
MATYYISPTGNDSTGAGTSVSPWQTISKAYTSSTTGDTIVCLAGTFTWVGQSFGTARTITGQGIGVTIFDGANAVLTWSISATVSITSISFQNASSSVGSDVFEFTFNAVTLSFTTCSFTNLVGLGNWAIFGTSNNPGLVNLALTFTGCLFNNCIAAAAAPNVLFSTRTSGGGLTITMINNTLYSNVAAALTLTLFQNFDTMTNVYTNNIFYNANGTPQPWAAGGALVTSETGSNNDIIGYSSPPSLPNQLSTDPLFVDPVNNNFNLRPISPCIGAGTMI